MRSWRRLAYRAIRPLLFAADPERVHHMTLAALSTAARSRPGSAVCRMAAGAPRTAPGLTGVEVMGLRFRNRVGIGAGFDKDGVAARGWSALGVGFVEFGTVTPRPQPGSARPRLYRLRADEALVNRMGFNNGGADALARRLDAARPRLASEFVLGVSIGRNAGTPEDRAAEDYVSAATALRTAADFIVVNVSSPNTAGLRDLQAADQLFALVQDVSAAAGATAVLVKLSADLDEIGLDEAIDAVAPSAAGVVLSNTSVRRDGLTSRERAQRGGLSGRPLLGRMLSAVARARARGGRRLAIVASGGIASGDEARAAMDAGADLVQLWTGLVYNGPGLIGEAIRATDHRPES